jgi:hypothetical protein
MTAIVRERKSHIWEREEHEHYVEPSWTSQRLFDVEKFVGEIWDPACGFGTIVQSAVDAGYTATGTDIADRGWGTRLDFLSTDVFASDNIVTNPPFDIAPAFIQHALKLARHKVAAIFPVARLNAARWLQSTPLARVWLLTPRPSMPPGHVIANGEKPGGGKVDFCWLVFAQGHTGGVQMGWLHRDKE